MSNLIEQAVCMASYIIENPSEDSFKKANPDLDFDQCVFAFEEAVRICGGHNFLKLITTDSREEANKILNDIACYH